MKTLQHAAYFPGNILILNVCQSMNMIDRKNYILTSCSDPV